MCKTKKNVHRQEFGMPTIEQSCIPPASIHFWNVKSSDLGSVVKDGQRWIFLDLKLILIKQFLTFRFSEGYLETVQNKNLFHYEIKNSKWNRFEKLSDALSQIKYLLISLPLLLTAEVRSWNFTVNPIKALDISKSFDTVRRHVDLLHKLPDYEISSKLCSWISSYLSEREI